MMSFKKLIIIPVAVMMFSLMACGSKVTLADIDGTEEWDSFVTELQTEALKMNPAREVNIKIKGDNELSMTVSISDAEFKDGTDKEKTINKMEKEAQKRLKEALEQDLGLKDVNVDVKFNNKGDSVVTE